MHSLTPRPIHRASPVDRTDLSVRDSVRVLAATIVALNERIELLEAREELRRPTLRA